ncbi:hypothetical protein D3C76_1131040 [compost metagenome]
MVLQVGHLNRNARLWKGQFEKSLMSLGNLSCSSFKHSVQSAVPSHLKFEYGISMLFTNALECSLSG